MIVKSLYTVAKYIQLDENIEFPPIQDKFHLAEQSYLKPLIGAFLAVLDAVPDSSGAAEELIQAHKYAEAAVAYFGMYKAVPNMNIRITGAGFTVNNGSNQAPASQWRVDQLRADFLQNGYESLDILLSYIEEKADKLAAWKDSEARKALKWYIIADPHVFDTKVKISASRMTYEAMRAIMVDVQDIEVQGILTESLYTDYIAKLQANDVKEDYLTLHQKLLPAVANLTIATALQTLPLKISNQSLVLDATRAESMKQSEDIEAQQPLLQAKIRHHQKMGKKYLAIAHNWLLDNTDKFESYTASTVEGWENTEDSKIIVLGGNA